MASRFELVQDVAPAATGTDSFSVSFSGDSSVGLIAFMTRGIVAGTIADDYEISVGFASGSGDDIDGGLSVNSDHNTAETTCEKVFADTFVFNANLPGTTTAELLAPSRGTAVDAFDFEWTTQTSGDQPLILGGVFGGSGVECEYGTITLDSTAEDSGVTVTGLGFQPDAIIILHQNDNGTNMSFSLGVVDTELHQFSMHQFGRDNQGSGEAYIAFGDGYCAREIDQASQLGSWECTAITSDGFTITMRNAAAQAFSRGKFLAIRSDDWRFHADKFLIPLTGNEEVACACNPDFLLEGITLEEIENGRSGSVARASSFGLVLNDGSSEWSASVSHQDDADPMVCKSLVQSGTAVLKDDGTLGIVGTTALGTGKFTKTITTNPVTNRKFAFFLAAGVDNPRVQFLGGNISTATTGLAAPSGSNRMAYVCVFCDDAVNGSYNATALTLGGQSCASVQTTGPVGTERKGMSHSVWRLNESGIAAMSGNALSPTFGDTDGTPDNPMYSVMYHENVDQTTPEGTPLSVADDTTVDVLDPGDVNGVADGELVGFYNWGSSTAPTPGFENLFDDVIFRTANGGASALVGRLPINNTNARDLTVNINSATRPHIVTGFVINPFVAAGGSSIPVFQHNYKHNLRF